MKSKKNKDEDNKKKRERLKSETWIDFWMNFLEKPFKKSWRKKTFMEHSTPRKRNFKLRKKLEIIFFCMEESCKILKNSLKFS